MVRPDTAKWGQTLSDLRRLSVEAEHTRTRERFQALYMIGGGQTNANRWSKQIGRCIETVLNWIHIYNKSGPDALRYERTGGRLPLFSQEQVEQIVETICESEPVDHGLPGHGWTLKKIRQWVAQILRCRVTRNLLRRLIKRAGLSWKKCKKVLKKANPEKRLAYIQRFQSLFEQVCKGEIVLLYVDEAHFHRDLDLGYTWARKGQPAWRISDCPPLAHRINWYGAYDFTQGQCMIWNHGNCNGEHTVEFLHKVADWIGDSSRQVVIIWDGAPCHRAKVAQAAAAKLGLEVIPLPGYSPDLNPIEGLWKWMREDVTQHHCHATMYELFGACKAFIERINLDPEQIISRLWPKFELDPEFEKLLVST